MSLQLDALHAAGCDRIFTDQLSGAMTKRPGLDEVLAVLQPGDVLTVWGLDRLGRTMRHVIETVTGLAERGIGFQSLTESYGHDHGRRRIAVSHHGSTGAVRAPHHSRAQPRGD